MQMMITHGFVQERRCSQLGQGTIKFLGKIFNMFTLSSSHLTRWPRTNTTCFHLISHTIVSMMFLKDFTYPSLKMPTTPLQSTAARQWVSHRSFSAAVCFSLSKTQSLPLEERMLDTLNFECLQLVREFEWHVEMLFHPNALVASRLNFKPKEVSRHQQ